jgi:hypothetical protein
MYQFTSEPRRCELAATQIARITSTRDADALRLDTSEIAGTPMTTAAYAPRRSWRDLASLRHILDQRTASRLISTA